MSSKEIAAPPAVPVASSNGNRSSGASLTRKASSADSSSASSLTPSQTIRGGKKNNLKNNRTKKNTDEVDSKASGAESRLETNAESKNETNPTSTAAKKRNPRRRKTKPKHSDQPKADKPSDSSAAVAIPDDGKSLSADVKAKAKRNRNRNRKRNNNSNNDKRYPWRAQIPENSVDPITLDPLDQLVYPPFALAAHEPYEPVPEWPPVHDSSPTTGAPEETEEERQRRILQEQWGQTIRFGESKNDSTDQQQQQQLDSPKTMHYNLFDGRALAYYMVSQLQFIDPLNRRDLTRDELVNLDRYLRRNGFHNLNVTEAYDAKGVTLSTAGAVASTAAGRAQIMQQEAAVLLQALFGGNSVSSLRRPTSTNNLAQQYEAYEQQSQHSRLRNRRGQQPTTAQEQQQRLEELGIYGDEQGGLVVIDDNMNPGLRGNAPDFVPSGAGVGSGYLWSASHIATRHNHAARLQAQEFPSLAATAATKQEEKEAPRRNLPKAKTLSKISSVVKQTTEEEKLRQWEAREAMKRKAALSNLTFGSNIAIRQDQAPSSLPVTLAVSPAHPSEGQVERNRALADALGVVPSTIRQVSVTSGWARPTDPRKEFGDELQVTVYPDSLILQARDRMGLVEKMERKWKTFLEDDKEPSLSLNPMDRASRTFVHHYSDFWNLDTESYDPEPYRYIRCAKVQETMAPFPLLSVAAREWRGPRAVPLMTQAMQTNSRDFLDSRQRQPLQLRSASAGATNGAPAVASTLSGAPTMREEEKASARFDGLAPQRPKLELKPRTAPLEMPPFEPPSREAVFDVEEAFRRQQERMEEKARQDQEMLDAKRKALEAAFASDSEDDAFSSASTDSDEWVEQQPLYQGSDEE